MQTYPKKRVEIVIETPLVRRVLAILEQCDVTGCTVLPVIAGRGHDGIWSSSGQVGDAGQMQAIICITDSAKLDSVLEGVLAVVARQIGFVTVSDVAVIRPERF